MGAMEGLLYCRDATQLGDRRDQNLAEADDGKPTRREDRRARVRFIDGIQVIVVMAWSEALSFIPMR